MKNPQYCALKGDVPSRGGGATSGLTGAGRSLIAFAKSCIGLSGVDPGPEPEINETWFASSIEISLLAD